METVLVLNADFQAHQQCSLAHAVRMLVRGVAEIHESVEGESFGPFPMPRILRLVKYIYIKFHPNGGSPRYSRSGVLRRDSYLCAYCEGHATTIDHVLPRSRGGTSTWLNVVSACRKCNETKKDRTPAEASMVLRFKPFAPSFYSNLK